MYFQGLALHRLGREEDARARFAKLVAFGRAHQDEVPEVDYFAVSLPDFQVIDEDPARRNRIHCGYMQGLGHAGLGEEHEAGRHLDAVLALDPAHLGAWTARQGLEAAFVVSR